MIDSPDYEPHRVPYVDDPDVEEAWRRWSLEVDPAATFQMARLRFHSWSFDMPMEVIAINYGGTFVAVEYMASGQPYSPRRQFLLPLRELLADVQRRWDSEWECTRCGSSTCVAMGMEGVGCGQRRGYVGTVWSMDADAMRVVLRTPTRDGLVILPAGEVLEPGTMVTVDAQGRAVRMP